MNISIPRVELRSAQTRLHQTELTSYLCVHYPSLSGVRGVARMKEDLQIPDVVTGVWWWRGVTRMSSPQPRVKCTHVQWAPGETRRGQNVKYSPGILSKSPQHLSFMISDQASRIDSYFKHRNVSSDNGAPACLWCEPRSQFLSTYDRACLWWCLVFMAVNWSILLILTVPVKHERDTSGFSLFSSQCSHLNEG